MGPDGIAKPPDKFQPTDPSGPDPTLSAADIATSYQGSEPVDLFNNLCGDGPSESISAADLSEQPGPPAVACGPVEPSRVVHESELVIASKVAPAWDLRGGRWIGSGLGLELDLRIDRTFEDMISGDIFTVGDTSKAWLASFRTEAGNVETAISGSCSVTVSDFHGQRTPGLLSMQPIDDQSLWGSLYLSASISGLEKERSIPFVARHGGDCLREIEIVWHCEKELTLPTRDKIDDFSLALADVFERQGLRLVERSAPEVSKPRGGVWGTAELLDDWEAGIGQLEEQLESALRSSGRGFARHPVFRIELMCLGKSSRKGLLGVMFDLTDRLPRQGAAVFADEDAGDDSVSRSARLLRTTIHEIGHALNLVHRFGADVNRPDSVSFMNNPDAYPLGRDKYWRDFQWCFDKDELAFIHHGESLEVMPGGTRFGTVSYWEPQPIVPGGRRAGAVSELRLDLLPPERGAVLEYGAPVFLGIQLTTQGQPREVPKWLLDAKAGFCGFGIRRKRRGATLEAFESFRPCITRCFDETVSEKHRLNTRQPLRDNVQLTYGSDGFPFVEPGAYEVSCRLLVPTDAGQPQVTVQSNTLALRIANPHNMQEELDADMLLRTETGLYFSLGAPKAFEKTDSMLEEIATRREHDGPESSAIVAAIRRAQAIDAGRRYNASSACGKDVLEKFDRLTPELMNAFDRCTREATEKLRERQRERRNKSRSQ